MRSITARIIALTLAIGLAPAIAVGQRAGTPEEAIMGFDPIELIGGSEVLGESDITVEHGELRYLFVSTAP